MYANKNFAYGALASQLTAGATSMTLESGQGALFPATGTFIDVIWGAQYNNPIEDTNREIITATFSSGETFTISRGKEGTTDRTWAAGSKVAHVITAAKIRELETILAAETVSLTHNTAWDGSTGSNLLATVNGSAFTIANPSSAVTYAFYSLYVTFTTSHAIAFGANFKNVSDLTPSNTAGMYDHYVFRYDGTYMVCVAAAYDVRRS